MDGAVRGVLFDLDNTLHDRDRAFLAWAQRFARERLGLGEGEELDGAVAAIVALDDAGFCPREELLRQVKERHPGLVDEVETLVEAYREQVLAEIALDEGAGPLLEALDRAGLPWGIVTNGAGIPQMGKIARLGLEPRTSCLMVSEVVGCWKPEAAIFRMAAAKLGVDPEAVLFVGDNPEADIAGAAGVGMRTAWLRRGRGWPAALAHVRPTYSIDSLAELIWVAAARG